MKKYNISINPIGLVGDFADLFEEISTIKTSSDNWFQQYKINPEHDIVNICHVDEFISDFNWSDMRNSQSSTKNKVLPLTNEQFIKKYREMLQLAITKSPIYRGEDNEMSLLFFEMYNENKVATLNVLNDLYLKNIDDDMSCVKILSLCNDYSEKELYPTAQVLAALSINHKSDRVKSAAMNLFSHWGTKDAYKLLCAIECPNVPWIRMKFSTIKKALESRWCMQEK